MEKASSEASTEIKQADQAAFERKSGRRRYPARAVGSIGGSPHRTRPLATDRADGDAEENHGASEDRRA